MRGTLPINSNITKKKENMLLISLLSFYITSIILYYIVVRKHTILETEWSASDEVLSIIIICMLIPILNTLLTIYLFFKLHPQKTIRKKQSLTSYIFKIKE